MPEEKKGYQPVKPGHWLSYGDLDALQFLYDALNTDTYSGKLTDKKVAIVGAGYAGLCAALCLKKCGADVTLYESEKRLGGRVWSSNYATDLIKETDGAGEGSKWIQGSKLSTNAVYELGAELIGEFHECYKVLAEHYGLEGGLVRLDDADFENESVGAVAYSTEDDKLRSVVPDEVYSNVKGPMEQLVLMQNETLEDQYKNFDQAFDATHLNYTLGGAADSLTFTLNGGADVINATFSAALAEFTTVTPLLSKDYANVASINLNNFITSDNLETTDKMSYLTLFYTAQGAGCCDFWADNETYINCAGNSSIVTKVIETLGASSITTDTKITSIVASGGETPTYQLNGGETAFDAVVLTVPPANFSSIVTWPGDQGTIANQLNPGQAAAYKAHFNASGLPVVTDKPSVDDPIKITKHFSPLDSIDYSPYYMAWNRGALVSSEDTLWSLFAGASFNVPGNLANDFANLPYSLSSPKNLGGELSMLDRPLVYPIVPKDEKILIRWVENPSTKTGYSYGGIDAAPTNEGKTSKVKDHLVGAIYALRNPQTVQFNAASLFKKGFHFAGEHTSPYFMGFMEGALRSGARAALKIVKENP